MKQPLAAAVAAIAAPFAVAGFAVASGAIQPRHYFGSPILYLLLALSWFAGLPLFVLFHGWLRLRLQRYLLAGLLLVPVAWLLLALKWGGLPPMGWRQLLWLFGHPLTGALVFWATLRLLWDERA